MTVNFILIDGSYFIFYRYFAIKQWFKFSHPDEKLDVPIENDDFIQKFKETFQHKMNEIGKKLKISNPQILVGKDCKRSDIWRNEFISEYKNNRKTDKYVGSFFELTYKEKLFFGGGAKHILSGDKLEADDCIAITTTHILKTQPNAKIWIITSDMDYLQLACENVKLINLKYKNLTDSKTSFNNPYKDLFCKIVMGDKSDNIPSVFKKCGIVTASKYYEDRDKFNKKLDNKNASDLFKRNRMLIDFNYIPTNLKDAFSIKYGFI